MNVLQILSITTVAFLAFVAIWITWLEDYIEGRGTREYDAVDEQPESGAD